MNQSYIITKPLLWICLANILFFSCKTHHQKVNSLEVSYISFDELIDVKDNLKFTFNHEIIQDESLTNQWIDVNYLKITPEVKGKYKWNSPSELTFSPSKQFEYATEYVIQLNNILLDQNKILKKWSNNKEFIIHTPYLKLLSAYASWQKDQQKDIYAKITAEFNIPISHNEVQNNLTVKIDDETLPYKVVSESTAKVHTWF